MLGNQICDLGLELLRQRLDLAGLRIFEATDLVFWRSPSAVGDSSRLKAQGSPILSLILDA